MVWVCHSVASIIPEREKSKRDVDYVQCRSSVQEFTPKNMTATSDDIAMHIEINQKISNAGAENRPARAAAKNNRACPLPKDATVSKGNFASVRSNIMRARINMKLAVAISNSNARASPAPIAHPMPVSLYLIGFPSQLL
jgi:hypothetical protein